MSLLLAIVFGLTVFAGCGQTSDPGGDPPPGTGTQPENPPEHQADLPQIDGPIYHPQEQPDESQQQEASPAQEQEPAASYDPQDQTPTQEEENLGVTAIVRNP